MTASNLHTLPPGQVPVIGLPRSAMGVSNPRVLHRRMLINNNNNNNNSLGISGAKRCLFGSPEPGEIQELYREEMRKNRERFLKRYNYDIFKERFVNDNNEGEQISQDNNQKSAKLKEINNSLEESTSNSNANETIEERLHEEACDRIDNLPSSSSAAVSLASNSSSIICALNFDKDNCDVNTCNSDVNNDPHKTKIENLKLNNNNQASQEDFTKTSAITTTIIQSSPKERFKPYSRQFLVTDYYNTRKSILSKTITVRQLPKPQKVGMHHEQITAKTEQQNQKKQSKQNDEEDE